MSDDPLHRIRTTVDVLDLRRKGAQLDELGVFDGFTDEQLVKFLILDAARLLDESVSELGTGGAPMSATELTRSDADENLDACRVRCHVCGARVYVGETAHDVEPGDDGVERFACAEHCETCR